MPPTRAQSQHGLKSALSTTLLTLAPLHCATSAASEKTLEGQHGEKPAPRPKKGECVCCGGEGSADQPLHSIAAV